MHGFASPDSFWLTQIGIHWRFLHDLHGLEHGLRGRRRRRVAVGLLHDAETALDGDGGPCQGDAAALLLVVLPAHQVDALVGQRRQKTLLEVEAGLVEDIGRLERRARHVRRPVDVSLGEDGVAPEDPGQPRGPAAAVGSSRHRRALPGRPHAGEGAAACRGPPGRTCMERWSRRTAGRRSPRRRARRRRWWVAAGTPRRRSRAGPRARPAPPHPQQSTSRSISHSATPAEH